MATIAVFNQKGGAGRTTTVLNLLAAIARHGERPLGIDLDPQGHLSQVFGAQPKRAEDSVLGVFTQNRLLADIAQITKSGVVLCPSHADLSKVDALLGRGAEAVTRLARALQHPEAAAGPVLIDCDRLQGSLTLNALFAADLVIVPVSSDFLSLRGALAVERALDALAPVRRRRPERRYLLTRFEATRPMSAAVADRLSGAVRAGDICATRIRECASVAESPMLALDVFRYAPASDGALDFEALRSELASGGFLQ